MIVGVAPHSLRAVTPDELREVVAAAPSGGPVHIHVAEQSREVEECCRLERATAGRMAAVARAGRRPLVPRPRDAHDDDRGAGAGGDRRRRGPRADDGSRPRRRHLPGRGIHPARGALRHRQRFEHLDRPVRRTAAARVVAAAAAAAAQRAGRGRGERRAARSGPRRRATARGRADARRGRSRPAFAPTSSSSTPTNPRSRACRSERCWTRRSSVRAGGRCATSWWAGASSCAKGVTRRRTRSSRASAGRWRG